MTNELRDKYYGRTLDEYFSTLPGELPIDAVGLWQVVPSGRDGFGLSGSELDAFVRRGVLALLAAGAVPVRHVPGSDYEWDIQKQYGDAPEEIADAVVAEWRAMPDDPLHLCGYGVWLARARPGKSYVKLD